MKIYNFINILQQIINTIFFLQHTEAKEKNIIFVTSY